MTTEEFSNEFDVLVNSNAVPESFGTDLNPLNFDEYEKSLFLTQAQEQIVRELYSGISGFESTEQVRRYLADLINSTTVDVESYTKGVSPVSKKALLPPEVMFITYEAAYITDTNNACLNNKMVEVVPVTQDEYHRVSQNPFRMPNTRKVLRLDLGVNIVELVSAYPITKYYVRYLRRPKPIILADISDEVNGISFSYNNEVYKTKTECELNPDIHRMILDVAVANAIKSRSQGSKSN